MYSLKIKFHKNAVKKLKRIPKEQAVKILDAIKALSKNPFSTNLDIRKVLGRDYWRLRVGVYRVFYVVIPERDEIVVLDIRHRKRAYKK